MKMVRKHLQTQKLTKPPETTNTPAHSWITQYAKCTKICLSFLPQRHIHAQNCSDLETGDHICFSLALQIFYCYCSLHICVIAFNVASVIHICITAYTNDTWVSTKAEKSEFLLKLLDLNVSRTFFSHIWSVPVFIKIYKMLWKFGEHLRTGSWNMHTEELPSWAILAKCLIADPQILKCALYHY